MSKAEFNDFASPDETREFEKGKVELIHIGGGVVGKMTLQPGWRWSLHVKPIAKKEWCENLGSKGCEIELRDIRIFD